MGQLEPAAHLSYMVPCSAEILSCNHSYSPPLLHFFIYFSFILWHVLDMKNIFPHINFLKSLILKNTSYFLKDISHFNIAYHSHSGIPEDSIKQRQCWILSSIGHLLLGLCGIISKASACVEILYKASYWDIHLQCLLSNWSSPELLKLA